MTNPVEWSARAREYIGEVEIEFKKVTWPTQKETIASTVGTCVIVLVLTVVLSGVDLSIGWVVDALMGAMGQ